MVIQSVPAILSSIECSCLSARYQFPLWQCCPKRASGNAEHPRSQSSHARGDKAYRGIWIRVLSNLLTSWLKRLAVTGILTTTSAFLRTPRNTMTPALNLLTLAWSLAFCSDSLWQITSDSSFSWSRGGIAGLMYPKCLEAKCRGKFSYIISNLPSPSIVHRKQYMSLVVNAMYQLNCRF